MLGVVLVYIMPKDGPKTVIINLNRPYYHSLTLTKKLGAFAPVIQQEKKSS
jgi:hypothetical protein